MKIRRKKSAKPKLATPVASPTRIDPTRTLTLRRQFAVALKQPYLRLKVAIQGLLVGEDVFGLLPRSSNPFTNNSSKVVVAGSTNSNDPWEAVGHRVVANTRWMFQPPSEQVNQFEAWLRQQLNLQTQPLKEVLERYAAAGFAKGAGRAFDDTTRVLKDQSKRSTGSLGWYTGTRDEFLRSAFNQPETIDKVKLLVERGLRDVQGVNEATTQAMLRVLANGLVQGKNPKAIAKDLADVADGVGKVRAEAIARTEVIRAHADGQLDALKKLGVTHVGAAVEWATAGDGKVCKLCRPLQGIVLTLQEAQGMLPRHVGCRCAWLPWLGPVEQGQKTTRLAILQAIQASTKASGKARVAWKPGVTIAAKRPQPLL